MVEVIDFEVILAERKAALIALYPEDKRAEVAATLALESEPLAINLQENAYREVLLRQRINDAARAVMLAFAQGADLDHLAALLGVQRLVVVAGTDETPAVMESDTDLRKRVQLAPESFSVAGPEGAYIAATLKADGRVLDAGVKSPAPGAVLVTILSREGDGSADEGLIAAVANSLNAEDVRPLTDSVTVQSAEILEYTVAATIFTFPGPDSAVVVAEARKRLDAYVSDCHRIGRAVVISGLHAALQVEGIERVVLTAPAANVQTNDTQAPYCTSTVILYGGVHG
jgi:phage-related baseplate assembly protein